MNSNSKLEWHSHQIVLSPALGKGVTIVCPTESEGDAAVEVNIGHSQCAGQWILKFVSLNGHFYIDKSSGGIVLIPKEITDQEIILPDKNLHLVRLKGERE